MAEGTSPKPAGAARTLWSPEAFLRAWNFAARAHGAQKVPGTEVPYLNHLGSVATEVMTAVARSGGTERPDLAVQCALLHDVLEDTGVDPARLAELFGEEVAAGVRALSKDEGIPGKEAQMADSLERLRRQPREVQMVKLADRITNLQPPPFHWSRAKIRAYREEAGVILAALGGADELLRHRLEEKLRDYARFCGEGEAPTTRPAPRP